MPDMIAAEERDGRMVAEIEEKVKKMLVCVVDAPTAIRCMPAVRRWVESVYYSLTWLMGSKTLGEEYSLLHPVDMFSRQVPSYLLRLSLVLLVNMKHRIPRHYRSVIYPLHLILFYWNGQYLDIFKRLLGIRYIHHSADDGAKHSTRRRHPAHILLAIFTLANAMMDIHGLVRADKQASCRRNKCPLCLDQRTDATATPCGHVYCWSCLNDWLSRFPSCPICRSPCNANQVYTIKL